MSEPKFEDMNEATRRDPVLAEHVAYAGKSYVENAKGIRSRDSVTELKFQRAIENTRKELLARREELVARGQLVNKDSLHMGSDDVAESLAKIDDVTKRIAEIDAFLQDREEELEAQYLIGDRRFGLFLREMIVEGETGAKDSKEEREKKLMELDGRIAKLDSRIKELDERGRTPEKVAERLLEHGERAEQRAYEDYESKGGHLRIEKGKDQIS